MIFSRRERMTAIVACAGAVIFFGDRYLLSPFLAYRDQVFAEYQKVCDQKRKADNLLERWNSLAKGWQDAAGLKASPSEAESQAQHAVRDFAQETGVELISLKADRIAKVDSGRFQQMSFHVNGNGSMASIVRMLWSFDATARPLRVDAVQITPRKEATDDLTVQLTVSTLCLNPEGDKPTTRANRTGVAP